MRFLVILCLSAFPVMAAPVPHAILNDGLTLIDHYENHDAGLINSYRNDPAKASKVEKIRLLVVPSKPTPTLQQTVEPFGTNINDGGYTLTSTDVTQVWRVRNLTQSEIASANASTASQISAETSERMLAGNWENGYLRAVDLQSRILQLVVEALVRSGVATNLSVQKRQTANSISNELAKIHAIWLAGNSNYTLVSTSAVVAVRPTNFPPDTIVIVPE